MMRWRGHVRVPVEGGYTFETLSDDGSLLYIDQELVVDNDGDHGPQARRGVVALTAGFHAITILYYERGGGAELQVRWSPAPGVTLVPLTSDVLSNDVDCPVETRGAPGGEAAAVDAPAARWIWTESSDDHSVFCRLSIPQPQSTRGALPVGEEGSMSFSNQWRTVELQGSYTYPVVIGGVVSNFDAEAVALRVRNVRHAADGCTGWCFDARLQEPGHGCTLDDHGREYASWMVLEVGSHMTDEGAFFEVGRQTIAAAGFTDVWFNETGFASADVVVLAHVQTYNSPEYVTARQDAQTSRGFSVALEGIGTVLMEPHDVSEDVGWFAIQRGAGQLGGRAYSAAVSSQSVTEASTEIDFGTLFTAMPRFYANLRTYSGADAAAVRLVGGIKPSSTHLLVREDHCVDDELSHTEETVGLLTLAPGQGVIRANAVTVVHAELDPHDAASESIVSGKIANNPPYLELGATNVGLMFRDLALPASPPVRGARIRFQSSGNHEDGMSPLRILGARGAACDGFVSHPTQCTGMFDAAAAELAGGLTSTSHGGYSGAGFVDFMTANGDTVTFRLQSCDGGAYEMRFYYALAGGSRPMQLSINGAVFDEPLDFAETGSWLNWRDVAVTVALDPGMNTVVVRAVGNSGPNLDGMRVTPRGAAHSAAERTAALPFGFAPTAASVLWRPTTWARDGEYFTPDLSAIVEELASQDGWTRGQSACIVLVPVNATGTRKAYTGSAREYQAPYFSTTLDPCKNVRCGSHGGCIDGACVCMGGFFGAACETPPGPIELCGPIGERFLPGSLAACSGAATCTPECAAATTRVGAVNGWPWARFAKVCNLEGALADANVPAGCAVQTSNNSVVQLDPDSENPGCAWDNSRCVARLDAAIVGAVTNHFAPAKTGKGLTACFGAYSLDACEMMEWCAWRFATETVVGGCGPRSQSAMSVVSAAYLQADPLYDAALDPQAHALHLAEECGRHSEYICAELGSCAWSPAHARCIIARTAATSLFQLPSCSGLWQTASQCRGLSTSLCYGACKWSGAGQACLLDARNCPEPSQHCGLDSQCDDDTWGLLASNGMTCDTLLSLGNCSTDLSEFFGSWPAGVSIASLCQESCAVCQKNQRVQDCVDSPQCGELTGAWVAGHGWHVPQCVGVTTAPTESQHYNTILPEALGPSNAITFDVKAAADVRIGFFSERLDTTAIFEVVLGGWDNTFSAIRQSGSRDDFICAHEYGTCICDGMVQYGFESTWTDWLPFNGSVSCGNRYAPRARYTCTMLPCGVSMC
jgi:hypothetical protein